MGFLTINPGNPVSTDKFLPIDKFDTVQKQKWYDLFYKQDPGGGTPLPEALSRAGRYFAGKHDGINNGMDDDPMQYSCQQNFTILTTDGYWNGYDGKKLDASKMDNQDSDSSQGGPPDLGRRHGRERAGSGRQRDELQRQGHARRRRAVLLSNRPASGRLHRRAGHGRGEDNVPTGKTPGEPARARRRPTRST